MSFIARWQTSQDLQEKGALVANSFPQVPGENYPELGFLFSNGDGSYDVRTDILDSPDLTGNPTAPTPSAGDSSDRIATTAFVSATIGGNAPPDLNTLGKLAGAIEDDPNFASNIRSELQSFAIALGGGGSISGDSVQIELSNVSGLPKTIEALQAEDKELDKKIRNLSTTGSAESLEIADIENLQSTLNNFDTRITDVESATQSIPTSSVVGLDSTLNNLDSRVATVEFDVQNIEIGDVGGLRGSLNDLDLRTTTLESQIVDIPISSVNNLQIVLDDLELRTNTLEDDITSIPITSVVNLQSELNGLDSRTSSLETQIVGKAPIDSPAFTGLPTTDSIPTGNNIDELTTVGFVDTRIGNAKDELRGGTLPTDLDTLTELAAAINNDPNYYQTVNGQLANKLDNSFLSLVGGTNFSRIYDYGWGEFWEKLATQDYWFLDNMRYEGGLKYLRNGYAAGFHIQNGDIKLVTAPENTSGNDSIGTANEQLIVRNNGDVEVKGTLTASEVRATTPVITPASIDFFA